MTFVLGFLPAALRKMKEARLSGRQNLVFWEMLSSVGDDGVCRALQIEIAERSGVSQAAVSGAVRRLIAAGLVERVHRGAHRMLPGGLIIAPDPALPKRKPGRPPSAGLARAVTPVSPERLREVVAQRGAAKRFRRDAEKVRSNNPPGPATDRLVEQLLAAAAEAEAEVRRLGGDAAKQKEREG